MDSEIGLLSRMIAVGGVDQVIAAGIEPRHFNDDALRVVFETCVEHVRLWRVPPSIDAVRRQHPDYKLFPVTDDLGYLIKQFNDDCGYRAGVTKWRDIGDMLDKADAGDHEARAQIPELFAEHAREMATLVPIPRSSRLSDMSSRILTIKRQQEAGTMPGVRLGIPQLDPWIHVVRPTEFVVHCAASGKGKTTGLVRSTSQAYSEGEEALLISLEMEDDEVWEIFDAKIAELSRTAIAKRELSIEDYDRYQRAAERVSQARNEVVVIDDIPGGATIDKVAALVDRYGPSVVAIDYISLMKTHLKSDSKWERVAEISTALKYLARSYKIKLYVAAQNNRQAFDDGPTEDNIAFSSSIFMDCNRMVGYHQDPEMAKINKIEIRLIKNRGGPLGPIGQSGYGEFFEHWDRDKVIFEDWSKTHEWMVKQQAAT
jgi:KaiC/GvpD/RAD55 family RecA-like ATPase